MGLATLVRVALRVAVSVALAGIAACTDDSAREIPPPPGIESLNLSDAERADYAPISFDKLFEALEIADEDTAALESVIGRVNRRTIGWSGVVQSSRVMKQGLEVSEFSLNVSPPSQRSAFVPGTIPVLVEAPNDSPIASIAPGTPIVFVGRLEFDGFSRAPWVLQARLVEPVQP